MPRRLCLLAIAAAMAALPSSAAAKGFSSGVASAEVTRSSAVVWTRADKPGRVTLTVARDARLRRAVATRRVRARAGSDNTVEVKISRLQPGRRYFFRFTRKGGRSGRGSFRTAPKPGSRAPVEFAWTGDADPVLDPGTRRLH